MHFGIGEVPKAPTDDRFVKIFACFFAILLGRSAPFLVPRLFLIEKHFFRVQKKKPFQNEAKNLRNNC